MLARGAAKNEATVAESRLRSVGKRKWQKKILPLPLVLIFIIYLLYTLFNLIPWTDTTII